MEREKRKEAQRLANSHLLQTLGKLIDSPIYEVFGQPYEAGETVRVRRNVYKMPILCFCSAVEDYITVGSVAVHVETGAILSCSTRGEVLRVLADIEERFRLLWSYGLIIDDR